MMAARDVVRWSSAIIALLVTAAAGCTTDGGLMPVAANDCYLCHVDDYESATNPTHVGVNPTTCWECHTTDAWRPAKSGQHPEAEFSIAAGHHSGILCTECHDADRGPSSNGANTDCIGCHLGAHLIDDMNASHRERAVVGYPDNPEGPNFCLSCHPDGNASATSHPEDAFSIATGHHSGIVCSDCHDSSRGSSSNGANTDCIGCHLEVHLIDDMNASHRERAVAGYPDNPEGPNFCLSCHPDGTASASSHPEDRFPIDEGHHSGIECLACHDTARGSSAGGANTDCIDCHLGAHPRGETDPMHSGVSGYPAGDAPVNFCLTCHPRGIADARSHPESVFPTQSGPHEPFTCNDCHNSAISAINSRENTDCVGCHTGEHAHEEERDEHWEQSRFRELQAAGSPHFCLECHPHGRAE
jgi:hypothetical protein